MPQRRLISGLIGAVILVFGVGYLLMRAIPEAAPEAVPIPNAYDDFVAAGEALKGELPDAGAPITEYQAYISANRDPFEWGRRNLTKPSRVATGTRRLGAAPMSLKSWRLENWQ